MRDEIKQALERGRVIDITTKGRKTGQPRRLEIWFANVNGRIYITGLPGKRGWYANMASDPEFTFHLKGSFKADLPAQARLVVDEAERGETFTKVFEVYSERADLEEWVKGSPLVEVEFQDI